MLRRVAGSEQLHSGHYPAGVERDQHVARPGVANYVIGEWRRLQQRAQRIPTRIQYDVKPSFGISQLNAVSFRKVTSAPGATKSPRLAVLHRTRLRVNEPNECDQHPGAVET